MAQQLRNEFYPVQIPKDTRIDAIHFESSPF